MDLKTKRKFTNKVALTLSVGTMAFGLFWLAWILWTVLELGVGGLSLSLFTEMTPPPGAEHTASSRSVSAVTDQSEPAGT